MMYLPVMSTEDDLGLAEMGRQGFDVCCAAFVRVGCEVVWCTLLLLGLLG